MFFAHHVIKIDTIAKVINFVTLTMIELHFKLDIEDDWPPFAIEGVPCTYLKGNNYRIETPPLFIKNISVGDVVAVTFNAEQEVVTWVHIAKSNRTTIWLLRLRETTEINKILQELSLLNCKSVSLPQYGCYSIDVPAESKIDQVDACLAKLNVSHVAVAYPSFRH